MLASGPLGDSVMIAIRNCEGVFGTFCHFIRGIIKSDNEFKVGLNYISADRRIGKETEGLSQRFHQK
jgi:hypothetical protein